MRSLIKRQTLVRLIVLIVVYLVIFNIHTTLMGTFRSDCPSLPSYPWRQAASGQDLRYMLAQAALERRLSPAKSLPQDPRLAFHRHWGGGQTAVAGEQVGDVRNGGRLDNGLFDVQGRFSFNQSRYPPHRLPIFPDESDAADDRIWNQMRYVPAQMDRPFTKRKKILLYNGLGGESPGNRRFHQDKCPVRNCDLMDDRGDLQSADVVLWQHSVYLPVGRRPPGQVWAIFFLESPYHTPNVAAFTGKHAFNWTATYRHESVIVAPYYKFTPYTEAVQAKARARTLKINFAKGKHRKVAWFVSNCGAQNGRLKYAEALRAFIQVDIYGACGTHHCPRSQTNSCFRMLSKDYKFYLAFENSNCRDYITEKFFLNGLSNNILPIVMGAHPDDYRRAAPPNSYIHVDDFAGPEQLAAYLKRLDEDDALYNSYFAWKGSGLVDTNTFFWCRLCMMAHEADNRKFTYPNMQSWWHQGKCVPGAWPATKRTWSR